MTMKLHSLKIRVEKYQKRVASVLQCWFDELTPLKKKISLLVFISAFSVVSLKAIFDAVITRPSQSQFFKIDLNRHQNLGKKFSNPMALIDTTTFLKIEQLKKRIDSLARHDSIGYRKLINGRPHFLDSIRLLENYYYHK